MTFDEWAADREMSGMEREFAKDAWEAATLEWQPIETAPKWGSSRHLAVMKNGATAIIVWLDADHPDADDAGWYEHWQFDPVEPTHWMPLPAAPNAI